MVQAPLDDIVFREATEDDAEVITNLFRVVYGEGYVHPRLYENREVKRMIFQESSMVLVAEHEPTSVVVGAAGVLFEMGAYTDLVGEFGRLVVDPEWRGRGIGSRLMEERLRRLGGRLHVGFAEVRVDAPASARISQRHGFVPVGVLPQKLIFDGKREHAALLVRHFGEALALRRNHPRVIPEAYPLADIALGGVGLETDVVLDGDTPAHPGGGEYELRELSASGYAALLRIERGRIREREVFGPQRLQYGMARLAASDSTYLVAQVEGRVVGAIGFMRDDVERHVRVFEVIHTSPDVICFLFHALTRRCEQDDTMGVEVDVGAHATRMQRTLLEMDYLPCAYVPAMAFHDVERVDVIKMYRLFQPLLDLPFEAPEPTRSIGLRVLRDFATIDVRPHLRHLMRQLDICRGLTAEQSSRLVVSFEHRALPEGTRLFAPGDPAEEMVLVVEGEARVEVDDGILGSVGPGECLGEVAFLSETPHAAGAVATRAMEVGVLRREALEALVRRRPDIGTVVYRNLARGLGSKLRRADGLEA